MYCFSGPALAYTVLYLKSLPLRFKLRYKNVLHTLLLFSFVNTSYCLIKIETESGSIDISSIYQIFQ